MTRSLLAIPTGGTLGGLTLVQDVNAALGGLVTFNAGAGWPSAGDLGLSGLAGVYAHNATTYQLAKRDQADTAWITMGTFDETAKTFTPAGVLAPDADGTLGANSDSKIPTQKAVKTYAMPASYLDVDSALAANSDSKIPTQKAVKAYVDAHSVGSPAFKNLLIGGDFTTNPWQRGVSFTSQGSAQNGSYYADRWRMYLIGSTVWTISQITDSPTVSQAGVYSVSCLEAKCTTAVVLPGATDEVGIVQVVEGLNSGSLGFGQASASAVTLSFWVKAALTGTYSVALGNSGGSRNYCATYTVTAAGVWQKVVMTIPGDTAGTWLYTSGKGIEMLFTLVAGSTYQGTPGVWSASYIASTNSSPVNVGAAVNNYFRIALVQLEAGSVASAFEALPEDVVLARCQRYYVKLGSGGAPFAIGACQTATAASVIGKLPVTMRAAPTLGTLTASAFTLWYANTSGTCSSLTLYTSDQSAVWLQLGLASGMTAGYSCFLYGAGVPLSAEL